ncbi:MAG: peptidylprolyl isomerase [Chloroflexota bacterium]
MVKQTQQQAKVVSKKHLARKEREDIQTRYIIIVSVAVIATIFILIVAGLLNQYVVQPNRAVAEVNGDKISVQEFQASVRYQRARVIENYQQLAQYFGDDQQLQQQLQQALADTQGIGQDVLDSLIDDRLIRQEAERRGITVTKDEIDQAIEEAFGYYPDGQPTATPTTEAQPTSTLTSLQETLTAPTATTEPTAALTETVATATATATLAPSPTASENLTPTATATPYTEDAFKDFYKKQADVYKEVGVPEQEFRRTFERSLYREKVMDAVLADMELQVEQEQVWARHILVSDLVTATMLLDEVNNGGDFAALAQQYSTDTASSYNGGDLGWFSKGKMAAEFEAAAWNLQVGEVVSQPVQTQYGYHVIQVLGHEVRPLSDSEFQQLRQTKFQEWLDEQRKQVEEALTLVIHEFWTTVIPNEP